jgi:chorismate mutase
MAFFADPSHMAGDRRYLQELSQRAMDLGLDGLMVESHCNPSCAWSDARQQLTPQDLRTLLERLVIRENSSEDKNYKEGIDTLRARIDVIDEQLLTLLQERMEVSRSIGRYKKEHNVAILQAVRWEQILSDMVKRADAMDISREAVLAIMTAIHDESVRVQNKILEQL